MYDISKIKLIIWDLDETFWKGTISEENIDIPKENKSFINVALDKGIIHSICSKNDFEVVKEKLKDFDLWDSFVFPSIDWAPKGQRIKQLIQDMALRPANVLFIDDNLSNINEAIYFCPEIMTATPNDLPDIIHCIGLLEDKDKNHKRLHQYRVLESKHIEKSKFLSNDEFLMSSKIKAVISFDCKSNVDRVTDLIQRSNQLNYTKNRMSAEEIEALINDNTIKCGCVSVSDRFGDYGIVGFFAVKDNKAIHFAFSCRTLGMRIEQWTYMQLNCPEIVIVGETIAPLNNSENPKWVNYNVDGDEDKEDNKLKIDCGNILFKGPCDMQQIFSFINDNEAVYTEFTYVGSKGQSVEGHNTTAQILSALTLSEQEKKHIIETNAWFDKAMFDTLLCDNNISCLILSMLSDGNLGIYRHREKGFYVSLCENCYDLTDEKNWNDYIDGNVFTSGIKFTQEDLRKFASEYTKVDNSDGEVTMCCLDKIYNLISSKTKIILLLGSEREELPFVPQKSYVGRNLFHKMLNKRISQWAKDKENVGLMFFDKYINSKDDFVDTINHFTKRVYFDLSKDIVSALDNNNITNKNESALLTENIKQKLKDCWLYENIIYKVVVKIRAKRNSKR